MEAKKIAEAKTTDVTTLTDDAIQALPDDQLSALIDRLTKEAQRRGPSYIEVRLPTGMDWVRVITGVKPTAKTGYDWEGGFAAKDGRLIDMTPGSLIVVHEGGQTVLLVVSHQGSFVLAGLSHSKEWAIDLRAEAIDLLARTHDQRIRRAESLDQSLRAELSQNIGKYKEWLSRNEGKINAMNQAIKVRAAISRNERLLAVLG
jgi:hypothetical protein